MTWGDFCNFIYCTGGIFFSYHAIWGWGGGFSHGLTCLAISIISTISTIFFIFFSSKICFLDSMKTHKRPGRFCIVRTSSSKTNRPTLSFFF